MKVLHCIYDHADNPWVGGGGAVRVRELCKRLAAAGHEITILSGAYPGAADYREGTLAFNFVGTGKDNYLFSTFAYAWEAALYVKKYGDQFDVVIEDFAPWNPIFAKWLTKRPVILHVNHQEGKNILRRWLMAGLPFFLIEAFYPRAYRRITILSEETGKKIRRPDSVIVPVGIDRHLLDDFVPSYNEANDSSILYVGRLHMKNKGLDTLIYAMKDIASKLLLAGKGSDEERLRNMAERLELDNLEFLGFITETDKLSLLRKARLFVLPSRFEGWGIVVIEAAACGLPVVVSDIRELKYAVDAGFGLSFKTGDAKDLAEKINLILGNSSMRQQMGIKAREYAKKFTWDSIAQEYEKYLLGVAGIKS